MAGRGPGGGPGGGPRRLAVPASVGIAGLVLIGFGQTVPHRHAIEHDLTTRSAKALGTANLTGLTVSFSGRDATITGAARPGLAARAETVVEAVDGVRVAHAELGGPAAGPAPTPTTSPAPAPTPTPTASTTASSAPSATSTAQPAAVPVGFTLADGTITVTGTMASAAAKTALMDAVTAAGHGWKAVDRLTVDPSLAAPPPARTRFPAITRLLATAPLHGAKLVIQYDDDWVILRGRPATPAAERTLLNAAAGTVSATSGVRDGLDVPGYK